jgi:hypothetical protein
MHALAIRVDLFHSHSGPRGKADRKMNRHYDIMMPGVCGTGKLHGQG